MLHKSVALAALVVMLPILLCMESCAALGAATKKSIIDDAEHLTCLILNASLPDAKAIAIACGIADEFLPDIEKFISANKSAAAMKVSAKDAGR